MTRIKRPAATAGAAVLLALSLSACGGGAPADASEDEFCDAWNGVFASFTSEAPTEEEFDEFKDKVDELNEVGTPEDISDEQRDGFEVLVDVYQELEFSDIEELQGADSIPGVSAEEEDQATDFLTYASETCTEIPDDLEETPTE